MGNRMVGDQIQIDILPYIQDLQHRYRKHHQYQLLQNKAEPDRVVGQIDIQQNKPHILITNPSNGLFLDKDDSIN